MGPLQCLQQLRSEWAPEGPWLKVFLGGGAGEVEQTFVEA